VISFENIFPKSKFVIIYAAVTV